MGNGLVSHWSLADSFKFDKQLASTLPFCQANQGRGVRKANRKRDKGDIVPGFSSSYPSIEVFLLPEAINNSEMVNFSVTFTGPHILVAIG